MADNDRNPRDPFSRRLGPKERRRIRARREKQGPWFWLGMMGLVGWSVSIPTVVGLAIGYWVDQRSGGRISWTLTGLVFGVAVGALTAWFWIQRERSDEGPPERR